MKRSQSSRRDVLKAGVGAAAIGTLGAPFVARHALGQSSFNWKRFAGSKIDVLLVKNPRSELMQAAEKEFLALTGIEVSSEQVPEQQQRQKAMIEFTSGKPTFDVAHLSMHVQKRLSEKGKWMDDLRPLIADASMTNPEFDFSDYRPSGPQFLHGGRRQAERHTDIRRLLDPLLQQGALRSEGRRLPQEHGRDLHGSPGADGSRPRACTASSRAD